jgi:galactose mutarotase-like enzyme
MEKYMISNEQLEVVLTSKGAEILSIKNKETRLDYIWNADPAFWPKTSPVLFPVVGGLKDNAYFYEGKAYQLTRHGFARDNVYEVIHQNAGSVNFVLVANTEIKQNYPFNFEFHVLYELKGNALHVTYLVKNTDEKTLPFSVGAHPAFRVPLVEGTDYNDYYLLFNEIENAGRYQIAANGLIETTATDCLNNTNQLPLTKELFYKDALVFKELKSNSISILSNKTKHGVKVQFDHFPYMGIWSFKNANFVCIEPWCGIGDGVNTTQQLTEKEGINFLSAGETFSRTWSVELF